MEKYAKKKRKIEFIKKIHKKERSWFSLTDLRKVHVFEKGS